MNQSQRTLTSDYNVKNKNNIMHCVNIVGTCYNVLLDTIVDDLTLVRYHLAQGMLTVS